MSVLKKDGTGTGMETQDKKAQELAETEGHVIVATVLEYAKGPSDPFKRKKLGSWLSDPEKLVQFDGIIAAKVDRVCRDAFYAVTLRDWCRKNGKTLIIVEPRLIWPVAADPMLKMAMGMIWTVLEGFAEAEWQMISDRRRGSQATLKSGGFVTSKPPWGYSPVKQDGDAHKVLEPNDEDGRKFARKLFEKCADGTAVDPLARWLEESGAETRAHRSWRLGERTDPETGELLPEPANAWWGNTVRGIIRNPVYKGRWCEYAREVDTDKESRTFGQMIPVPGEYGAEIMKVAALVDPVLWQAANDAMDARGKRKPRSAAPAMLSGRTLSCADCGGAMYRLGDEDQRQGYYRCAGRGPQRKGCGQLVPMDSVNRAVDWAMRARTEHVMTRKIVPGSNWAQEKADVQGDLNRLPVTARARHMSRAEENAERQRLWDLQDELETRKTTADTVQWIDTGRTYADEWKALTDNADRDAWMQSLEISVTAGKGEAEVTLPSGKKVRTGIATPAKAQGSHHGAAKLTEDIVRACRTRYATGESQAALAREFSVSDQALSKAIRGLTWGHVETGDLAVRPNPCAKKLTADIVRECRTRHAAGELQKTLAAEFGVSALTMSLAIRGITWKEV